MSEPPRSPDARILTLPRFWRLLAYGSIMATGTIGVFSTACKRVTKITP